MRFSRDHRQPELVLSKGYANELYAELKINEDVVVTYRKTNFFPSKKDKNPLPPFLYDEGVSMSLRVGSGSYGRGKPRRLSSVDAGSAQRRLNK